MAKLSDNIRKIAKTAELDAKIRAIPEPTDKNSIPSTRGIGNGKPIDTCPMYFALRDNSYDIGDLLAGTAGPTIAEKCSRLDTITGLTDFDTSHATASFGGDVHLIIQVDGIFT